MRIRGTLVTVMLVVATALAAAQSVSWAAADSGVLPARATPVGRSPDGRPVLLVRATTGSTVALGWDEGSDATVVAPNGMLSHPAQFDVYVGGGRWLDASVGNLPNGAISATGAGSAGSSSLIPILRVKFGGWILPAGYDPTTGTAVEFINNSVIHFSTFQILCDDWVPAPLWSSAGAFQAATDLNGGALTPLRVPYGRGIQLGKYNEKSSAGWISYGGKEITVAVGKAEVFIGTGTWKSGDRGLPVGAIPAGKDDDGTVLYMIRAMVAGSWSVGKLSDARNEAYVPWSGEELKVARYDVLCYDTGENLADSRPLQDQYAAGTVGEPNPGGTSTTTTTANPIEASGTSQSSTSKETAAPPRSFADGGPGWASLSLNPGYTLPAVRFRSDYAAKMGDFWGPWPTLRYDVTPVVAPPFVAGSLTAATSNRMLAMHNLYRYAAGLPGMLQLDPDWSTTAQYGAVLMAAVKMVAHNLPFPEGIGMDRSFYERGYEGTMTSNIHGGPQAYGLRDLLIDQMDDSYNDNLPFLGHRRWLIAPNVSKVGYGQAGEYVDAKVFGNGGFTDTKVALVAWPPAGALPFELFFARQAWSLSINQNAFAGGKVVSGSNTRVTITRERDSRTWSFLPGTTDGYFTIDHSNIALGYCIIFKPNDLGLIQSGDAFLVHVTGLRDGTGAPLTISYRTELFSSEADRLSTPQSVHPATPKLHVEWQSQAGPIKFADSTDILNAPVVAQDSAGAPLVRVKLLIDTPEGMLPIALQINGESPLYAPGEWAHAADNGPIRSVRIVYGGLYHLLMAAGISGNNPWTGTLGAITGPWTIEQPDGEPLRGLAFLMRQ